MRARVFDPARDPLERAFGSVLAKDATGPDGHAALRKGVRLGPAHRTALAALGGEPLHLIDLDDGELEQDEVARRLAAAIAGPGTAAEPPAQGQARLRAATRGLLRARGDVVVALNRLHPLLVFAARDGTVVAEGDDIAGAKSASLATAGRLVAEAERIARIAPILSVAAFERRRVAVVVTDRLESRGRALVREAIQRKIEWFGSELMNFAEVAHESSAIAAAIHDALSAGAELMLFSGASSLDPLDPIFTALEASGGAVVRTGVPAHPGSMAWVGAIGEVPALGIATCSGFGKDTALDLLLARVLAGESASDAADALGAGGLVEGASPGSPFPPYTRSSS
jgi:molybdenum cofactor cytidylyltransferase